MLPLPLLSSPQAGAFNYSCPPLQPVHAGLLPSAFSCAGWEAPAAFPACWLWSGAGEPCREEEQPGFFPVSCTGDIASPRQSRGWRLEGAGPRLPRALPCSVPAHPGDYSINYFHKHFAFCRIFSHFLMGILHADVFFLLLFVQSFNAITSDTSPHQTSGLSLPLKRLTDDGPDTGNYYVRTVTANFNHNVPCERGRNPPTAGTTARGLGAVGSTAGLEWGPGMGQGAGGSALLPPSAGAAPGAGWMPRWAPAGPSPLHGSFGIMVHGVSGTHAPRDGQPFLALSSTGLALSELLCSIAVSPPAGLFPAWLPPP